MTAMNPARAMIAEAQAQTRFIQITLNIVQKHNKKLSEKFSTLDQCIYSNFNYESLHFCLTSLKKNKLLEYKINKTINQIDLVPITFGMLILKERNSKK